MLGSVSEHRFRRTTRWIVLCVGLVAGVGVARLGVNWGALPALSLGVPALLGWNKRTLLSLTLIAVAGLSIGLWRGDQYVQRLRAYSPLQYQKIVLIVQAEEDGVYGNHTQMSFKAGHVRSREGRELPGTLAVSGFGLNAVYQGDEIRATGKLYPGFGSNQGSLSFAGLELIRHHPSLIADIRRRFAVGLQNTLPEPLAPFAMGLLIGQRATLPGNVKRDLLMVGLTHIIAVSGYNLTIMLHAARRMLGRRSKRLSTLLSFGFIGLFLLLTGSSASIVRAAIISALTIGAAYYGRQVKPMVILLLAAAITAVANPIYVWSDASWYLSFLAFYGVLVLAPLFAVRLGRFWRDSIVLSVALESVCAEVMTLPFVLHTFGQISFIGVLANVLVVALVPLAMLLSVVAGLAGMLLAPMAGWFAWPARWLLTYMLDTAHMLSQLPHIFVEHLTLPVPGMLLLYGLIAALTLALWFKKHSKNGTVTDIERVRTEGA